MLYKEQQVVRESLISADSFWHISFSLFLSLFLRSRIDRCGDSMGPFMWRARGPRRGHQRALSQGPVCNYRHEAWPRGRTIEPLSLRLFQSPCRHDRISDLSAFGPSAIPSTRRGISIATIDRR